MAKMSNLVEFDREKGPKRVEFTRKLENWQRSCSERHFFNKVPVSKLGETIKFNAKRAKS